MKRIMLILGWLMVMALIVLSLQFISNYRVDRGDFITKIGRIAGEITTTKDEYGERDTSLRLYLEGEKDVFAIPGKLLAKMDKGVYQLKEGDNVEVIIIDKTKQSKIYKSLKHSSIWGIKKVDEAPYLTLDQAIDHHKSVQTLVYAGLFIAMAIGLGVYLTPSTQNFILGN